MAKKPIEILMIVSLTLLTACSGVAVDPIENGGEGSSLTESQAAPQSLQSEQATEPALAEQPEEGAAMNLTSTAFQAGKPIPSVYSCDGDDISPALSWSGVPVGVESYALIMDDPDAPGGTWDHWLLYDIPSGSTSLAEGIPAQSSFEDGSRHGSNSWGNLGYGGPCPPGGTHRYFFKLYALDTMLNLEPGASKSTLESAMQGHILAVAELMGTYSR